MPESTATNRATVSYYKVSTFHERSPAFLQIFNSSASPLYYSGQLMPEYCEVCANDRLNREKSKEEMVEMLS